MKAATLCIGAGFHAACNKETLGAGRLMAEAVNREIVRGAARAKDLIESMMKSFYVINEEVG